MRKLSVVLPSWGRYDLTIRMLTSIAFQSLEDYELFFLGDNCPVFEKIVSSYEFKHLKEEFLDRIIIKNFNKHDGTSAQAINYAMKNCDGEYFLFLSNDDVIFPKHFENYYTMSNNSKCDFGVFNTYTDFGNGILNVRRPELLPSKIGHSELCISYEMAKTMPEHSRVYGHDWEFICKALNLGFNLQFHENLPTYIVNLDRGREHNWEANHVV